jgi:Zn-dependent protease with chaperone function
MIDAHYYDGNSSRRHPVTVVIHKRVLSMRGEGMQRSERVSRMALSERLEHAPRILRFADGAFIEVHAQRPLDLMLLKNKFFDSRVVQWQNNWPMSLLALVAVLAILLSTYQWGIPAAADALAQRLPASLEKRFGDEALAALDGSGMLGPSTLPAADQARLRARFGAMVEPRGERTAYQLLFRASEVGANAFALPNHTIIMTDEMVRTAQGEEALLGVLSHELGHLQRRHTGRMLLKKIGVGLILNLWVGDLSSALAAVPEMLLEQKHSRDFEREADQYAIDMMQANGLPLEPMAQLFLAMALPPQAAAPQAPRQAQAETPYDKDEVRVVDRQELERELAQEQQEQEPARAPGENYLSSHPSDHERIARFRAADKLLPKPAPVAAPLPEPMPEPDLPTASSP